MACVAMRPKKRMSPKTLPPILFMKLTAIPPIAALAGININQALVLVTEYDHGSRCPTLRTPSTEQFSGCWIAYRRIAMLFGILDDGFHGHGHVGPPFVKSI
ncbi:MAG TPA: hypothetical protein DCS09_03370 [Porphyromonadaceae bacterium]|nr:hypothetical protein [Porphyromonadaceae bacterium]